MGHGEVSLATFAAGVEDEVEEEDRGVVGMTAVNATWTFEATAIATRGAAKESVIVTGTGNGATATIATFDHDVRACELDLRHHSATFATEIVMDHLE